MDHCCQEVILWPIWPKHTCSTIPCGRHLDRFLRLQIRWFLFSHFYGLQSKNLLLLRLIVKQILWRIWKSWTNMLETLILEGETKTITSTVQWFWDGSKSWKHQLQWCLGDGWFYRKGTNTIYLGLSPLPVTVTTRIITFLVGDPYKPSFAAVTGRGDNPIYIYILYCQMTSIGSFHFQPQRFQMMKTSDDYLGSSTGLPLKAMDGTEKRADPASFWGKRLIFRGVSG